MTHESTAQESVAEATNPTRALASDPPPAESVAKKYPNLTPWKPGQSGNPAGRPKIEPRVRRYARRYDRRMCQVLASIAEDPKVSASERRRAAMDLVAIGSGRPATTQELIGRPDAPLGPLVALTFNGQQPGGISAAEAYRLMSQGAIEADPEHKAFQTIDVPKAEGQS